MTEAMQKAVHQVADAEFDCVVFNVSYAPFSERLVEAIAGPLKEAESRGLEPRIVAPPGFDEVFKNSKIGKSFDIHRTVSEAIIALDERFA